MVSVRTTERKVVRDEDDARRVESLHKYLGHLTQEFNATIDDLRKFGIDANISVSDDGAAPGN